MLARFFLSFVAIGGVVCFAEEQTRTGQTTLQLGVAYQVDQVGQWGSVGEILPRNSLTGTAGWVEVKPLDREYKQTIGIARRAECVNGSWCTREWRVDLEGASGTVSAIEGIHELPEILNRPLTGDVSVRSEELKISQLQNQISEAISRADSKKMACGVCVSLTSVINPTLRMRGYTSSDSASTMAQVYAKRLGLRLGAVLGPEKNSEYVAELEGTVTVSAEFRPLKDSQPRFGRDKQFYFSETESRAEISADTERAELVLKVK